MEIARTMEEVKIPGWLTALINAKFLKRKGIQQDDLKYCCVDCAFYSLTETETFNDHNNHRVLQAFKASGHYGYQLKDIQSLQDFCLEFDIVSGICVYSINKLPILYPKSRVKPESEFSKKISSRSTSSKCCVTCGWTLIKDAKASFCSILCKLVNQFGENPAPVSPLKDQDCVQDRVFLKEEGGKQRTLLVKFNIRANNNKNGRNNPNEKMKVGVNGGGIKKKKPLEKRKKLADSITEEIEVINGKKMSSLKRKLQSLVSIAKEEEEEIKLQGFRKRSRKGVHRKPSRAPFF